MKLVFKTLCVALFLVSCQKTITPDKEVATAIVASDANSPINCHSISFTSDYPVKLGEVPPFSFTKTLYPDARVRTIRMLSRKNPIYPGFAKEAVELIGTFTYAANTGDDKDYAPHLALLKGTSEVWEYYKTPAGAGARRSVSKQNVNLEFHLLPSGYCTNVRDLNHSGLPYDILYIGYTPPENGLLMYTIEVPSYDQNGEFKLKRWYPILDQYGNITSFELPYNLADSYYRITYDYSIPRGSKNYSFIPSQNLISQEYSLLEVMQWLPQSSHQRKSAGGTFKVNGAFVNQDQVYKNFKFDAKGNMTSLTYGDNILQRTTWSCQN